MIRLPSRRSASVLGLAWHQDHLHVAHVERSRTGLTTGTAAALPLPLAALTPEDPAAAGAALLQALKTAGLHPAACVAALPPEWIMSLSVPLPVLPPSDVEGFIQLTAERGFPCPPEELQVVRSVTRIGSYTQLTLLAVRKAPLNQFAALLVAAGLRPLCLTLALPPAAPAPPGSKPSGELSLELDTRQSVLLGTFTGGVTLLRTLDPVGTTPAALARELRITWEQLPAAVREALPFLRVTGGEDLLSAAQPTLTRWADSVGLPQEALALPARDRGARRAATLARDWLEDHTRLLQFLPPQPSQWQRILARYPLRRLGAIGIAAGAILVLCTGALLWRTGLLWHLRERWDTMRPPVEIVEKLQNDVRFFRTWSDATPQNLLILRLISEAFPASGTVTAKSIEIRNTTAVSVTGTTIDSATLLKTLDKLRQTPAVFDLKLEQIHGRSPAQFTFKFTWKGTAGK